MFGLLSARGKIIVKQVYYLTNDGFTRSRWLKPVPIDLHSNEFCFSREVIERFIIHVYPIHSDNDEVCLIAVILSVETHHIIATTLGISLQMNDGHILKKKKKKKNCLTECFQIWRDREFGVTLKRVPQNVLRYLQVLCEDNPIFKRNNIPSWLTWW